MAKWRSFEDGTPLRRLGKDALVACGTALIARGLGFWKEIIVAAFYGLSGAVDIYIVAVVLIGFPLSILLNAVQTALVSAIAAGGRSPSETSRLFFSTTLVTLGCLLVILPLWLLLIPWLFPLLAAGFPAEKQDGLQAALFWLVPYYFLNAVNLLGYSVLQANRRYWANGLIPVATPIATILVVAAAGAFGDWRPLTAALVVGTAIETVWVFALLRRGDQLTPSSFQLDSVVRIVFRHSVALIPGTLMISMSPLAEQAIAASLGEGTNAALSYGYKLPSALLSISATAIGITTLPFFARLIAQRQFDYCLRSFDRLARWIVLGGMLAVLPLILFSEEIVTVLYQRRAFDAAAVARVSPVQLAYIVQIPFAILAMLALKTLSAMARNGIVSLYTALIVVVQTGLAYGLGLRMGAAGIAWAAAAGSAILAMVAVGTARRYLYRMIS